MRLTQASVGRRIPGDVESTLLSERYEDDVDNGDIILNTGHGCRDRTTSRRWGPAPMFAR
jgi:hypothetical protein